MTVGARKVPKWETELWSYISRGDGMHCPLYDRCRIRKESSWCVAEHIEEIGQLLEDRTFKAARCNFVRPEPKILGRPFQLVERLAGNYLKKGKVHGPPVPVELVSLFDPEHEVEIRSVPLKSYHGAIWHLKDKWVIQLKSQDSSTINRHTLFHEAFHILAHCGSNTPVFRKRGGMQGSFNEALADYFVGCILMPREWVREKWAEVKDVDRMAKIFDVPRMTMWLRLRQLGLA